MKQSILLFYILGLILYSACENYSIDDDFAQACGENNNTICLDANCSDGSEACLNELLADGLSTIHITAHVPNEIKSEYNEISFKTSKGNFPGEVDKDNPKVKSQDGKATVILNVGTVAGPGKVEAMVTANNIAYAAVYEFELDAVQETSLQFFIDEDDPELFDEGALADGDRVVRLTTKVNGLDVFNKKVKLTISGEWTFLDHNSNTVELNLTDVPEVECLARMSQKPGECVLRAEFEGRSELLVINSDRAAPATLDLVANPPWIASANGMTTLKAFVARSTGKVSEDTKISFDATQEQNGVIVNLNLFDPPFGKSTPDEIAQVNFLTPADSIVVDSLPILIRSWYTDDPEIKDSVFLIVQ